MGAFLFEVLQEKERLKGEEETKNQSEGTLSFRTKKEHAVAIQNKKIGEREHKEIVAEVIKQMKKTKVRSEGRQDEKRIEQWCVQIDNIMEERKRRLETSKNQCAWCQFVRLQGLYGSIVETSQFETFVGERTCTCTDTFSSELRVQLGSSVEPQVGSIGWIKSLSESELLLELQNIVRHMKDIAGLNKSEAKTFGVVRRVTASTSQDNFNAKATSATHLIKRENR